jgi:pimeloyl-ACP methyl ester carboxylesterase
MASASFEPLANLLAPEYRVVALDQRGHGYSDHAKSYTREGYVGDLNAFLKHLHVDNAILLGNSLGGVNAYQLAARDPGRVQALIIEDIGTEIAENTAFVAQWTGFCSTREALAERIGPRLAPYLSESFRETPRGWRLAFEPSEMIESQRLINGNFEQDWLASDCPALVVRGRESRLTTTAALEQMAARRPRARFVELDGGHAIHVDNPEGVAAEVKAFLQTL